MDQMKQIVQELNRAENILLFPHINIDGDALGSSVALCAGLRSLGKKCDILLEDEIPEYLAFMDKGYCVNKATYASDVNVAIDCGDASRIENRKDIYFSAPFTVCIDHHIVNGPFSDLSFIDPSAAATGMLVYELLKALSIEITAEIADALYLAILTDTGSFRYSNASKETHLVVSELYDYGLNHVAICNAIYDSMPATQIAIEALVLQHMEFYANGKACVSYADNQMLKQVGATSDQTECVVDRLRSIKDVEIAVFLKEKSDGSFKVSFRAKSYANVREIAFNLGGGGHEKASGCTINQPLAEALKIIKAAVEEELC